MSVFDFLFLGTLNGMDGPGVWYKKVSFVNGALGKERNLPMVVICIYFQHAGRERKNQSLLMKSDIG